MPRFYATLILIIVYLALTSFVVWVVIEANK
jgi:hypothetical protein